MVKVRGGRASEAKRTRAKRIQKNRIASLKRLWGFLCAYQKFSKLHSGRRMMLLVGISIVNLNVQIQRAHLIIFVWFLIFFPFPLLVGSIGRKENVSWFG